VSAAIGEHELLEALRQRGLEPHPQLCDMLNETYEHRTERRGCGYTQATRLLAAQINQRTLIALPRSRVFAEHLSDSALAQAMTQAGTRWCDALARSESRLLASLIRDIVLRDAEGIEFPVISPVSLKVGSCPLAEQFFLEIAYRRIRRGGRVNVIIDRQRQPLLIEKRGLGDDHSCITVAEMVVHGVRIPIGSLVGVDYPDAVLDDLPALQSRCGVQLPLACVASARLLRLTTLAVCPADRARAFSAHYQQQIDGGLFSPDATTIEQLIEFAREQVA
jgi:hypothetical protein